MVLEYKPPTVRLATDDEVFENQNKHSILAEILGPHESVGSVSGIMAQSFGDYYYENEMD